MRDLERIEYELEQLEQRRISLEAEIAAKRLEYDAALEALAARRDAAMAAKRIREEIVRQYRDDDRGKSPSRTYWEEQVQPWLLAEVALNRRC